MGAANREQPGLPGRRIRPRERIGPVKSCGGRFRERPSDRLGSESGLFPRELLLANGVPYSGGVFLRMGGQTSRGIAAFSLSSVDQPTFETGSIVRLADGRVRFR